MKVNGLETPALVDSGSEITTVSEDFYKEMNPRPHLHPLEEFKITAAGGNTIPYSGVIMCEIQIPFLGQTAVEVGAFVVPTTEYTMDVPVIIGTNAIDQIKEICKESEQTEIPETWKNAFISLQRSNVGVVKSTNKTDLKIQPMETVTVSGLVRKKDNIESAIMEQNEGASNRLGVCPRVVSLEKTGTYQRVQVRMFNISAKVVIIKPKSDLCELHEVKVLRSVDPISQKEETVHINQQQVKNRENLTEDKEFLEKLELGESKITSDQKEKVGEFLLKWKHIFSKGVTDLGNCDLVKHEIKLTDDKPFKEPHRRIPPAIFQEVREHLREMLEAGAIRPSTSPYSSNVVIVRKKDGSIRFCMDFRKLNSRTVTDAYAIPRVDDTLHLLAGAKYFSKLDLRSGYWQVEIQEEDKQKTAFQVGTMGFYEFNRMPFGLCNAPATFQRLMERCMGELNLKDCLIYLDDIIIFSSTVEQHLERLEAVFKRLAQHNLKLKASKCDFLRSRVTYLGHVVSEDGIETDPEKTEAVKNWPVPTSVKEVRAYLGFTGYYRKFIKNYARIARPLNDLLVGQCTNNTKKKKPGPKLKKIPFSWTEKEQTAFDTLKEKLMSPPILAYADYTLPFKLHTDASTTGLGAVLYQKHQGEDKVVAYASTSLKPSESNYPAHKLEFLAFKWAVTEKFHDYLYGAKFEVVTDNNPLTYVFSTAKLDATGQRWLAELSNYNCSISYRSGKNNADADGLSRKQEKETTTVFPEVLKTICNLMTVETAPLAETLMHPDDEADIDDEVTSEHLEGTSLSTQDWQKAQAADANINFLIDHVLTGQKPTTSQAEENGIDHRYMADWEKLKLKDGVLYRTAEIRGVVAEQLVLPDSMKEIVFHAYHDDLGHQGRDRTLSLIQQRFYWPGMNRYIANHVTLCGRCIRRKTAPRKAAELVNISSKGPMELVCIDYLTLERSKGGYENILVITDHFSRYAQAIPTRNQTAHTTAKALYENYFVHYGFPAKLHSDKGANFESKTIRKLCKLAGINKSRTTPYHPMGNGMVERFNKTLLNMLGTLPEDKKSGWAAHVSTLTHAYNAAIHESTGFSPYFLMFGRYPRLAVDAFLGLKNDEYKTHREYADQLRDRLKYAYKKAAEEAERKGIKYKHYYDQKVRNAILEEGDRVLVKKVGFQGKHKLADIWEPCTYVVLSQPMPDIPVYYLQKEGSSAKPKLLHRNMLLPFFGIPVSEERDTEDDTNEVVADKEESSDSYSSSDDDSDESSTDDAGTSPARRQPARIRPPPQQYQSDQPDNERPAIQQRLPRPRRPQRTRRPPTRLQYNDLQIGNRPLVMNNRPFVPGEEPFIITVRPEDIVKL